MRIPMAIVLAATFALPSAAEAATQVSNDGTKTILLSGYEPADVRIDTLFGPPFGVQSQLTDRRGGLVVGPGCSGSAPVVCPGDRLEITLNGGDDRIVSLGDSNQTVSGGAGADVIQAASQSTALSAGGGNDVVKVNSNSGSLAHGDGGSDVIWGFENFPALYGDAGNDFLYGSGGFNTLDGGSGNDTLVGVGGRLSGGSASGGTGNDVIAFRAGSAGDDFWTVDGGDGADTIVGSRVTDTIAGGAGADHIDVTGDARTDTVTCGDGVDSVYADPEDDVAADCEKRFSTPMPAVPAVTAALNRATHLAEELQPLFDDPRT